MFGATIDYYLLKPLAHSRNRATEEELDDRATRTTFSAADARAYLERVRSEYFDGQLPVDPGLSYLDVGCGMGRLCLGLGLAGAVDVTGVEIVERHVTEARAIAERERVPATFHRADIHDWQPGRQYDVVFVLGAMEHIHDPGRFLAALPRLLKPGGLAFVSHEPFQSPVGDHMRDFFRVQIPWRGLLFSERAILRLRAECYRPTDPATRYQEIVGGLNLMSFTRYSRLIREAGLEAAQHYFNPQVKHQYAPLYPVSWALTHIPRLQDFFIICAYSVLRRRR